MKRSRQVVDRAPGTTGPARLGRDTVRLLRRLEPGDIAVLDHVDLDSATAEALVARKVAAVVNASPSTSGRYPNLGPGVLVGAGVPLLDAVGEQVLARLRDGQRVRVEGNGVYAGEVRVATGTLQDPDTVAAQTEHARAGLAAQLADLATNSTGFLLDERALLLEGAGIPTLVTDLRGRQVLVVAASYDAAAELDLLKGFRREHRPLVIGVDGGADLLLSKGITPDLVVGDLTVISETALTKAKEVIGRGPASARLQELGVTVVPFVTTAASEDMALLLATHAGATSVVAVGYPTTLEQVLDRGRAGASSSLLVRVGLLDHVVGARAAAALSRPTFPLLAVLLLVLAAGAALVVAFAFAGTDGFDPGLLQDRWEQVRPW